LSATFYDNEDGNGLVRGKSQWLAGGELKFGTVSPTLKSAVFDEAFRQ
jgi:hypothetical protein